MPEVNSNMSLVNDTVTITLTLDSDLNRVDIWNAMVEPEQLQRWLGHVAKPLNEQNNEFVLTYLNGSDHRVIGNVTKSVELETLEFTWRFDGSSESLVTMTLDEIENGTRITFVHSNVAVENAVADGATWHAQFEFLSRWLHDRISLGAALRERRNELEGQYAAQLEHARLAYAA